MSTITNGSMKLIKSDITDIIHSTIGSDLPNNFDKIDKTVDEVNTRINNILTTPVDGVSAQEIIDARNGEPTLGTRLNSMQNQTDNLQEEVDSLSTTGIPKLVSFDYDIAATVDGQTVFTIPYEHLSLDTDTVEVFVNGIAVPDNYYIITEPVEVDSAITLGFVTLTEAKPLGTIVKVRILKNVPNGDEGSVDGDIITVDSMPINRIKSDELNSFMDNSLSNINTQLNAMAKNKDDTLKYCEYGLNEALSFASGTSTNGVVLNKVINESDLFILQKNGFIQIVEDGLYFIEGTVNWQSNNTGIRDMRLYGGGKFLVGNSVNAHDTLTTKISCSAIVYLSQGSTIYMTQIQNSGAALSVDNNFTHLKVIKIR